MTDDLRADEIREALADYASATRVPKWVEPLAAAARSWLTPDIEAAVAELHETLGQSDGPVIRELREALERHDEVDGSCPLPLWAHVCVDAARAYLTGLEQKPDIEAAALILHFDGEGERPAEHYRELAREIVDAALVGFQPQPDLDDYHEYQRRNEAPTVYSEPQPDKEET